MILKARWERIRTSLQRWGAPEPEDLHTDRHFPRKTREMGVLPTTALAVIPY